MIEVHVNEDHSELERLVRNAYSSIGYPQTLPSFRFGPVIILQGRMFQQAEISIECEDLIFRFSSMEANRTRVQTGSMLVESCITTPDADVDESIWSGHFIVQIMITMPNYFLQPPAINGVSSASRSTSQVGVGSLHERQASLHTP
ncbi:MAG: hypothetical protein ABSE48_11235 [Verrucomicrobiota bacterium]